MNAVFLGTFSAIPTEYVIKVKHEGPHGTISSENGSFRSKWTSATIFRIYRNSRLNGAQDFVSGSVSQDWTMRYFPGGVTLPVP
jgi:hypothetical protein